MREPLSVKVRIGRRKAYIHGFDGRVVVFMPDQCTPREHDLHNEVAMHPSEARRMAKALLRAADRAEQSTSEG